jgi:hypothetical protein
MGNILDKINGILGISNQTSAPIIITLSTFFLSLLLGKIGNIYKQHKQRKIYRQVFVTALTRLIEQTKNQSKQFKKTSDNLVFKNDIGFAFGRVQLLPINTFESIGYKQSIESFLLVWRNSFTTKEQRELKTKSINRMWEAIHSIHFWHQKSIDDTNVFLDKYNLFNERRNNAIEDHNKYFLTMLELYKNKPGTPEYIYIEKAVKIREKFVKLEDKTRPDIINDNLIQPLRKLNTENQGLEIADKMNFDLLLADHEYTNQKNTIEFYRKVYSDRYYAFRNFSRTMEKSIKILKGC